MSDTHDTAVPKRKLIEVSLPLEVINRESAREKSIRQGHPSTLHVWWSRKPLAITRAVLFAQLVDDPSANPDQFPTEEAQRAERERLHKLIERLVVWENIHDPTLLAQAREEILKSTGGNPPPILDPFAGGGAIPLEAQRLGLEAHASDLNPVAVLINKALIEIPPKFARRPPVFDGLAGSRTSWEGATGLAADVRAYGEWMRDEASRQMSGMYPEALLPDGSAAPVIAWIWARTVTCPNPACGIQMPLTSNWWLSKKTGKEAWVRPVIVADGEDPSGKRVCFEIGRGTVGAPTQETNGTVGRNGARCLACGGAVPLDYIRQTGRQVGLGARLMAVVAEGKRQRVYVEPTTEHEHAADLPVPADAPDALLSTHPQYMGAPRYGLTRVCDLFTPRQLLAQITICDLVEAARARVLVDALASGMPEGDSLDSGGSGAAAYADAVATYLGFVPSGLANLNSSLATWRVPAESPRTTFARQVIPMTWEFVESNAISKVEGVMERITTALSGLPTTGGRVAQEDATVAVGRSGVLSTDPPYYDNIPYADLSDFFYAWLRRSLRSVYPELLSTMLVPKADELVADSHRHHGKAEAKEFFEQGFRKVFERARDNASEAFPITVYYAFKQADSTDDGTASTGWETLLDGMVKSGWEITATWPVRSEASNRIRSLGANALASSIVLALRPRPEAAPTADRRGFIAALHAELPDALRKLQQGAIAPVDLPQAAIGPGMAVFSRYLKVIENDGTTMTVRSALARINEILDQVLNEQEGDFDSATRFAIAWYRQHGYATGTFGAADGIARARNTSVEAMEREGILTSVAGKVALRAPADMPEDYDVLRDERLGSWEVLHHLITFLARDGVPAAGSFLSDVQARPEGDVDLELVKELAFLLFSIAEKNGWTQDALAFNTTATAWPEIVRAAREVPSGEQSAFEFEEN